MMKGDVRKDFLKFQEPRIYETKFGSKNVQELLLVWGIFQSHHTTKNDDTM